MRTQVWLPLVIIMFSSKCSCSKCQICTALHHSAHDGNAEAAKVLLQAGASAFARNCSGATPRDVALLCSFEARWTPRVESASNLKMVFTTLGRERKSW
eukprot:s59_g62.t2